jgi:hypothetical protein
MHDGSPYGHLKVNSKVINNIQLGRMTGANEAEVTEWIKELSDAGVLETDETGCIYSRRMVRDEELRLIRAAGGKEGGNPKLIGEYNAPGFVYAMRRASDGAVKIGISVDPNKRLYKIKQQFKGDNISILATHYVENMGARESQLHAMFAHRKTGEWFGLNDDELKNLLYVHLKEKPKQNPTPSSSSSSSSLKAPPNPLSGEPAAAAIIAEYHDALPRCQRIEVLNPKRRKRIAEIDKLAANVCQQQGWAYERATFWRAYFAECATDPWLRGEQPNPKNPKWKQNLDVLIREDRFAGIMDSAISAMKVAA